MNELHTSLQTNESEESPSKFMQSANALFHFKNKREFIEQILKDGRISPRYVIEDMNYLTFPLFNELAIPMICFCDIKLHSIINHVDFYGNFGIGFNKDWVIEKGIQPVHYLNNHSNFTRDFQGELQTLISDKHSLPDENKDYIFNKLSYAKPIIGEMWDYRLAKNVRKIFHDENEWRYVPTSINEYGFKPFIASGRKEPIDNINYRNNLNDALNLSKELSLKFSIEDIKYLFVRDNDERIKLISYIFSELDNKEAVKRLLVSKIQTIEEIKEDY